MLNKLPLYFHTFLYILYICFLYICFHRLITAYWNQGLSLNISYLISYALSENLFKLEESLKEKDPLAKSCGFTDIWLFFSPMGISGYLFLAWILWIDTKQFICNMHFSNCYEYYESILPLIVKNLFSFFFLCVEQT